MKPRPARIKRKTPQPELQKVSKLGIRKLRGKYKHLDLMNGLIAARQEERQPMSTRTLKMLETSSANLEKGTASAPVDLPALRNADLDPKS